MAVEILAGALAETLLHFVWQGTLLACVGAWLMRRFAGRPDAVYGVGAGTMMAMALAPVATALWLITDDVAPGVGGLGSALASATTDATSTLPVRWILGIWACGASVCAVRMAGGWWLVRRLVESARPGGDYLDALGSRLARRLKVSHPVRVLQSAHVAVPMVVGWLKPVVLIPVSVAMQVDSRHLEALLLHELAHVKRHDYLVNLLQSAVEVVLFYHPAVWWMSRRVRDAREVCCDDMAVQACDRLTYVAALSRVASIAVASPAVAASGGSLRARVARLLHPTPTPMPALQLAALLPILLVVAAAMPVTLTPDAPVEVPLALTVVERDKSSNPKTLKNEAVESPVQGAAATPTPAPDPVPQSLVRAALPVALDFMVPAVNAAPLAQAPPQAPTQPVLLEVFVQGQVQRPGSHRLPTSQLQVSRAISVAGGFNANAGHEIEVRRGNALAFTVTRSQLEAGDDPALEAGDVLFVRTGQFVFVTGEVAAQGQKRWAPGLTVSRAIAMAGGMTRSGQLGAIRRPVLQPNGTIRYEVLESPAFNTLLHPNDELLITERETPQLSATIEPKAGDVVTVVSANAPGLAGEWVLQSDGSLRRRESENQAEASKPMVTVSGEVGTAGQKLWEPGLTVGRAVALAGGMTAKGKLGEIRRPVRQPDGSIKYTKIKGGALKMDTPLQPNDELFIARKWIGGN